MLWRLTNRSILRNALVAQVRKSRQEITKHYANVVGGNGRRDSIQSRHVRNGVKTFSTSRTGPNNVDENENVVTPSTNDYIKAALRKASLNPKGDIVSLEFDNLDNLDYPVIWLRDNCRCSKCFDVTTNSRIHEPFSFQDEIRLDSITSTHDTVSITWGDHHRSLFEKDWLCRHSFRTGHRLERLSQHYIEQISWTADDFLKMLPSISFEFDDIMRDDVVLLKWLETIATVGIAKIHESTLDCEQLKKLADRVSYIRRTHYGEQYYIKDDANASNVANKRGPLQMHTDLPYYQHVPGVILLHFVQQSTNGGENIISDGLNVVKQLPKKSYQVLANTVVDWSDIGSENSKMFYSLCRSPVISEDYMGNVEVIKWSQPQRDSIFNVSLESALEWYEGYRDFIRLIHDSKNAVVFKNAEGTILTFDNRRILHGRTDYSGKRFIYGAYLDWDDVYSKIRVLRQSLK